MKRFIGWWFVFFLCSAPAVAQRASFAPDAFLQDVNSLAGVSRIGSALFAADPNKQGWGDYCTASIALAERGEFRQAIRVAAKALYLGEKRHGNRGAPIIWATRDIANAYNYAGDHATASGWADRTLAAIAGGYDSSVHRDVQVIKANAHRIRALALSEQHRHAQALAEIGEGLNALPGFGTSFARSEMEVARASLLLRSGQFTQVDEAVRKLVDNAEPAVRTAASRLGGESALARKDAGAAITFFNKALSTANDKDAYQVVMIRLGLARALRLAGEPDAAAAQLTLALASIENLRQSFRSFEMRTALYGNLQAVFDEAVEFYASRGEAENALAASETGRARVMLDLQSKIPGGEVVKIPRPRTALELKERLPPGHAMVVYHQLPSKLIAWVITGDAVRMITIARSAAELLADVTLFRSAIEREDANVVRQAAALHAVLIAPLNLPKSVRLIFIPHRSLHLMPFQALHDGNQWLIETNAVGTSLSASLLEVSAHSTLPRRLVALGNPDLGRPEWDLPGSEREVKALVALYPGAVVSLKKEASKIRLIEVAPGADIVHVAAHAVIDGIDPMFSLIKLATAGAPGTVAAMSSDMEARELATLNLSQARLVALSACNSGLGVIAQGDEFMGFKRALFIAGARSALVSLWPVDDDATEMLMTEFHRAWKARSLVDAIREAQLMLLQQPRYRHPYYWAPFTLIGDPG